jgi:hypothetical protein
LSWYWRSPAAPTDGGADPGGPLPSFRDIGVPVLAARIGTWQQLVRQAPPSVLSEALGISSTTVMKHAERAGSDRAVRRAAPDIRHLVRDCGDQELSQ